MEKQFKLVLDTKKSNFSNTLRGLKQGDNNAVIYIQLIQDSIPFNLTGNTVRLNFCTPNNKNYFQNQETGVEIIEPIEGKIKVNILSIVLEMYGEGKADISIFDKNNKKITSATFKLIIEKSVYDEDAYKNRQEFDVIQKIWVEEDARIKQENTRVEAEKIRVVQETTRVSNEDARIQVEKERVEAENNRVSNEDTRKSNETNRDDAEKIRQTNEITRQSNEDARVKNESERLNNEKIREAQETTRQQKYINMQNTIDDFSICEAYDSTKDYKKFNRATFNGSSYECIKDCKSILPTENEYWICIAEKGQDGNGTGNMHTDIFDKNGNGIIDNAEAITDGSVTYTATDIKTNLDKVGDLSTVDKEILDKIIAENKDINVVNAINISKNILNDNIKNTKTVASVNGKTGEVTLKANDITTEDNKTIEEFKTNVESHLAETANKLNNLNTNDINARREILDMKLKLDEMKIVKYLNKTGIGFYDLFKGTDNVDTVNTTAIVDINNTEVNFIGTKLLKFLQQKFDVFNRAELTIYDKEREKFTVDVNVENSTEINMNITPGSRNVGEKFYYNGEVYTISGVEKIQL